MKAFTLAKICCSVAIISLAISSCGKRDVEIVSYDFEHDYRDLSAKEMLGKKIFFDKNLSTPAGLSCAGCHAPGTGFSDPQHRLFSEGAVHGSFINRNAPSIGYLAFDPALYYNTDDSTYIGGMFWDGRVNSFEDQAINPMLNHLEMNNADESEIFSKIQKADYVLLFKSVFGPNSLQNQDYVIQCTLSAIGAYERSSQLSPFTSKYDYYLKGEATLTAQELHGLELFNDTANAKCANCHPSAPDEIAGVPLFTDFSYDNIGLPHNPNAITSQPDLGLGGVLGNPGMYGQFKVPSLRNLAISAPYFHNGYFNTIEDAIRFYSERDLPVKYPAPEVNQNVNHEELGNLQLTDQDISDIAAFLRTLTDGYKK